MALSILFLVVALAPARVQESPPAPPAPATLQERYEALDKEFSEAQSAFMEKYRAAKDDAERQTLIQDYPEPEGWIPKFMALADECKGEPVALDCFVWALTHQADRETSATIYAALLADHVASPGLTSAVQSLGRYSASVAGERFLRAVIEKTPHVEVKGHARFALGATLLALEQTARRFADGIPEEQRAGFENYYGKELLADLATRDLKQMRSEAEGLLETVVKEHHELDNRGRGTLGAAAEAELFELRNLQIGMTAPDIEGEDVDGVPFKLSDYRGKVVVIDFWGFW